MEKLAERTFLIVADSRVDQHNLAAKFNYPDIDVEDDVFPSLVRMSQHQPEYVILKAGRVQSGYKNAGVNVVRTVSVTRVIVASPTLYFSLWEVMGQSPYTG